MKTYEGKCLYGGFRFDTHTVRAASEKAAKKKVRMRYIKRARREVTGITVREVPGAEEVQATMEDFNYVGSRYHY